jgi:hypothetical protein
VKPPGTPVASSVTVDDPTFSKVRSERATGSVAVRQKLKLKAPSTAAACWPRYANLALGIWLQVSAFAWPHADATRMSAWLPGLVISVVAVLSMSVPPLRWVNGVSAIWLLAWTAATANSEPLTYWSGVIGGALVFLFATVSSKSLASDWVDD